MDINKIRYEKAGREAQKKETQTYSDKTETNQSNTRTIENNESVNDFGDFVRKEDSHGQSDQSSTHLERLRRAMRIMEEEIRHIELRSENIT